MRGGVGKEGDEAVRREGGKEGREDRQRHKVIRRKQSRVRGK